MKGSVEERQPMSDESRPSWIVEEGSDSLVRALAFEQEDGLRIGQEDGVSVEGGLELLGAERRVLGEKRLRPLATVGFQSSGKDEAIHGGSLLPRPAARASRPCPASLGRGAVEW